MFITRYFCLTKQSWNTVKQLPISWFKPTQLRQASFRSNNLRLDKMWNMSTYLNSIKNFRITKKEQYRSTMYCMHGGDDCSRFYQSRDWEWILSIYDNCEAVRSLDQAYIQGVTRVNLIISIMLHGSSLCVHTCLCK